MLVGWYLPLSCISNICRRCGSLEGVGTPPGIGLGSEDLRLSKRIESSYAIIGLILMSRCTVWTDKRGRLYCGDW